MANQDATGDAPKIDQSSRWTGRELADTRRALSLSQERLAERIGISQSALSRLENSSSWVPEEVQLKMVKLLEPIVVSEPEDVYDRGVRFLGRASHVMGAVQEGIGTVGGAAIRAFFPERIQRSLLRELQRPAPVMIQRPDPSLAEKAEAARKDPASRAIINTILQLLATARRALKDRRGLDAIAVCEAGRQLTAGFSQLDSFWIWFTHDLGVAKLLDDSRDLNGARNCFEAVLKHPSANSADIAHAKQEMGLLLIDEVSLYPERFSVTQTRAKFSQAESNFNESVVALPIRSSPIIGLIELADRVTDLLADMPWVEQLLGRGRELLECMSPDDREASLRNYRGARAIRRWFPALSRRRDLIQKYLPWLLAVMILVVSLGMSKPVDAREHEIRACSSTGTTSELTTTSFSK